MGWTFRISEHARYQKEAWFITLTYDQDNVPLLDNNTGEIVRGMDKNCQDRYETLDYQDLTTFINSVKKAQNRAVREARSESRSPGEAFNDYVPSYYAVGEYGGQYGRPHYHIIMFNIWENIAQETRLEKIWKKGRIETEALNPALIHYATGYIHEKSKYIRGKQVKPKMQCSKGIGEQYVIRNKQFHKDNLNPWIWFNGYKIAMPDYYKDKIFTEEEKEAINKKIMEFHNVEDPRMETYVDKTRTRVEDKRLIFSESTTDVPRQTQEQAQWEHSINYRSKKRNKL